MIDTTAAKGSSNEVTKPTDEDNDSDDGTDSEEALAQE
jgi:hypothetical protein